MFAFRSRHSDKAASSHSQDATSDSLNGEIPLLLHFDVNKTILQTDSIQLKDTEDGIREGIAELFWGQTRSEGDKVLWEWTRSKPSCLPPTDDIRTAGDSLVNYAQFCKMVYPKDRSARKEAVKTFGLVSDIFTKQEMNKQLQLAMKKMQLPAEYRGSKEVEAAGVKGSTYNAFPALFHLVANLQRSKRTFAILFRSFGVDHEKVQEEWNAFCEMRHPIFSRLIEDIGPLDGTVNGVPDRRIITLHTMYRDSRGPVLILDTLTNGPADATWDEWARGKAAPKTDTRDGRDYIQKVLKAKAIEGIGNIQKFMEKHLFRQRTAAIKDDWAWWTFNDEKATAGKLMTLMGSRKTQQLFLDDNIEHNDARIVDCRDTSGQAMPHSKTLNKFCMKVNPVEAILDDDYFLWKLLRSQGEHLDMGHSIMGLQKKKLTEVETQNAVLQDQLHTSHNQLRILVDEMRRMRLQRRIHVRDEAALHSLLAKHMDLGSFGERGLRSISDLFMELEQGHCWLEIDEQGRLVRVLDMIFFKLCFKDLLLIETHEEDASGRISTRNFLPGMPTNVLEASVQQQIERWLERGLQVNLQKCIEGDLLPMYVPDAPDQQTGSTKAFPLPCLVHQSHATLTIPEKEVEINKELLQKIGLPSARRFTTSETDLHGATITRFWRWDKKALWERSGQAMANSDKRKANLDVAEVCDKLFKGNQRADAYKRLLLEMFETFESFEAQMLTGGFGGSAVIRVQPYEQDGRPSEPCVVKLDAGGLIRDEFQKSVNVFAALPDRAARILGDPVFSADEEFGAMRLELAGACWNNPELAQGSSASNLLSTFKDLLLYESEQVLLGVNSSGTAENRPFGNVNSVLAETFGPSGVVSSLRKGGAGLHRSESTSLLWGWYTLKGKPTPFNPYTAAKGEYPPEPAMRRLYKEHFKAEMPSMKDLGVDAIKEKLQSFASTAGRELRPLIGLAHGDLNAANIMIDASDALWMIDFATSVDLPLFTDMCKFEMACLFEYTTIPITPKLLVEFAGTQESLWRSMNVGDWLRTDQEVVVKLLQKLVALQPERLAGMSQTELEQLIGEVIRRSGKKPEKQWKMERALKARLMVDEAQVSVAFNYASAVSNALLRGDSIVETLDVAGIPLPDVRGSRGASSLKLFMDHCVTVRRFMAQDIMGCLRGTKAQNDLQSVDGMSLQLYLPFLREAYRIIGYRDIAPQYKVWAIYHCNKLAQNVQRVLAAMGKNAKKLGDLGFLSSLKDSMAFEPSRVNHRKTEREDGSDEASLQEASFWIYSHSNIFPVEPNKRLVRRVHQDCKEVCNDPGFFSPVWQVFGSGDQVNPMNLYFGPPAVSPQVSSATTWEIVVEGASGKTHIGHMIASRGRDAERAVHLKSRLLAWDMHLLKLKEQERSDDTTVESHRLSDDFSVQTWSGASEKMHRSASAESNPNAFLRLEAVAYDSKHQSRKMILTLILGTPVYCYSPGSCLCVDTAAEGGDQFKSPNHLAIQLNTQTGDYLIRNSEELSSSADSSEFDPVAGNHLFVASSRYQRGEQVLLRGRSPSGGWRTATVAEVASRSTNFQFRLQLPGREEQLRHLCPLNSGRMLPGVSVAMFEEESQRFKHTLRARLSFMIDPLSGDRLNVRELASLSLTPLGPGFGLVGAVAPGAPATPATPAMVGGSLSATSTSAGGPAPKSASSRRGLASIMSVVEQFEKGVPSCSPNAFLVLGQPGSGKTCLVHRLIMETMDRYPHIMPLLLPVADLVKRSTSADLDTDTWFDKYLRITFGEDSNRYLMICQAIHMNHAMFIFEGLEECGELKPVVERCIQMHIMQRRLVLITSRPLISGQSSLQDISECIVALKVENLTEDNIRLVAHTRLGNRIDSFDQIFSRVRGRREVADADDAMGDGEGKPEVFGNPMMLSMLLCYLQTMQRKEDEKKEAVRRGQAYDENSEDHECATITAVYRVAIDVMLSRMQRRQMADRLNKQEELERWKQILEIMAMHMVLHERDSILAGEVESLLTGQLRRAWPGMKKAVVSGHAMFLRVTDPAKEEMQFLVKDFMNFFAASATARSGGAGLPGLIPLFSDPGWTQMLEMLAEAWPLQYVRIVEQRLGRFQGERGDSYLHVAARAGHRPIFQNLRLFTERNRESLKIRNQDMQTPLHIAAEKGNTQLCALMLESGAPMDALDSHERLAMHVAMQWGFFQTAKFLWSRWSKHEHLANHYRPRKGRGPVEQLAGRMLGEFADKASSRVAEKDFLQSAEALFMELRFFGDKEADVRKSTLSALLAVFWITANHYDLFVRGQGDIVRLTVPSWNTLQEWAKHTVGLTQSTSMLSTVMVFVAIMHLGKIRAFRLAFAPEFDDPDEALANILQKSPILIPSFMKLDEHQQQAILSALKANFNFGQFLQAENLPANLSSAKQILMESGGGSGSVNTLGLFLFRNFASMCGILGKVSLEGSLFMNEKFYTNYKVGLDVLQYLMKESAQQVYERFLLERAKGQGLSFNAWDPESRARVRLACLTRVFDTAGGKEVSTAFAHMEPAKRKALIDFLNTDGIEQKPGFLLYFAPQLLENAWKNTSIGLTLGMEMLLQVYQAAAEEYAGSEKPVVTVMLGEIKDRAQACQDAESFQFTKFEIARTAGLKSDSQGTLRTSPWQLQNDPKQLTSLAIGAMALVNGTLTSKLREPAFLKKLPQVFPELKFFDGDETQESKAALKQTQLSLLTVYWVASDQAQAFTRGQDADTKLSAQSWTRIRALADRSGVSSNPEVLNAVFAMAALHGLGRLPKLRTQLAPNALDHKQAIAQVLDKCPKVLPSYWRLSPEYRQLVKGCLGQRHFNFKQFLNAESIPASITTIKTMLRDYGQQASTSQFLHLFVFSLFARLSATTGAQSLEGSLCMTEKLWREFEAGWEALKTLQSESESAVYNRCLQQHSKACGISCDEGSPPRAVARVMCLARVTEAKSAAKVAEAFNALANHEKAALTKHLTADGIAVKPGFVLNGGSAFFSSALSNAQVGLAPALRILLQVYKESEKHFRGSSSHLLTIDLERLAAFTQAFTGSVAFQEISFELAKHTDTEALVIPKVWIPVRNKEVLDSLRVQARKLAADILASNTTSAVSEREFKARVDRVFPELSYFNAATSEQLSKTMCGLLSVYWMLTGQHAAFIRGQPDGELLSKLSWSWIQGWMKQNVRLISEEAVDAMLTVVAISALGTISEFREEFAPRINSTIHDAVLAHILETQPEVVPSFSRLSDKYQRLVLDCFRVNFRFSEFLLAENVPANLAQVKGTLEPHGEAGLAFFCFRIFARACGKLGNRPSVGSTFMTESQFQRFKPGLDALQQLKTLDAGAAYNAYLLLLQGSRALACFTSPEHQALTRLLCLEATSEDTGASAISEAFKALQPRERERLTRFLTADGLGSKPGYVLNGAPDLLRAARSNVHVGLEAALRMLLRVQEKCVANSYTRKMYIHLEELAACAREASHPNEFSQVSLDIGYDDQGETRVCIVSVGGYGRAASKTRTSKEVARYSSEGNNSWSIWSMFSCAAAPAAGTEVEDLSMVT